ncbi:chemotaxis protein CheW [Alkalibacter mobilis]|uniref:chemotaxis protein CheW n=1 Tax=Alkalibacter mobilis TaxID=2787712 RepID=UPI00189DB3CF|nr:chemotaxis protein CheW [Alkalibacter mobilis]MBF7096347.1 purine-binding chemotaxis protein CheW [Alkalibacter mobilis]
MKQVIIFTNCNQNFALEISKIERIIEYNCPKKVPETSDYLIGVIKYNDKVLPIIDLNMRLYSDPAGNDEKSKIIVIQWNNTLIGLVVDEIIGIRTVEDNTFENADLGEGSISKEYIQGFIKIDEDIIILLETDNLFDFVQSKELLTVEQ